MRAGVAPTAFFRPISLVRSFTETIIIFISATLAPKSVIIPMPKEMATIISISLLKRLRSLL